MTDLFEKINRWRSPYEYTTDAEGVVWMHRKDSNGGLCGKPIKANDPNFVQGYDPDAYKGLKYLGYGIIGLATILLGVAIGDSL